MNAQIFGSPPTDNLYKFMALCGLIVLILSIGYPKKLLFDAQMKMVDLTHEQTVFEIRHEDLKEKIEKLKEQVNAGKAVSLVITDKEVLDHELLLENVSHSIKKLQTLEKQMQEITRYGNWGFWLGGLVSLFGFLMWYVNVQRPADKKVKSESAGNASPTQPAPPPSPV